MPARRVARGQERVWQGHLIVLCIDVGAFGNELVDEADQAAIRGHVERGTSILRWQGGGALVLTRSNDRS
jgi:hypothetical protein